ncbi:hypothetical protein GY45DRAFT_1260568 [Cubamyces sp. BRFM 1775]|nr:hypothetical protein GY45DRAFT_1260568 [Cubamyces sp. BRFM 1775]
MSSSETVTAAEAVIANRSFFFISNCALFAEAALIFHEYFITFDSEVRLIWRRRITGASVLFFLNRYIMIFDNVITLASYPARTDLVRLLAILALCDILGWMDVVLNLLPYFIWNAFSTMRVYAISGRDWRIASVVCLLMIGPIASNVYNIPFETPDNMPPPYNCQFDNAITLQTHNIIPLIAGDAIVLIVTWWKTYRLKKAADEARVKMSIVDMLLRDGTMYFGTMLVLNVLHIMVNYVVKVSFLGDAVDVLTSILVSRFIMNLRNIDAKDTGQITRSVNSDPGLGSWHATREGDGGRGTLVFASGRFVDSMGGPLEHSTMLARSGFDDGSEMEERESGADIEEVSRFSGGVMEELACGRGEKASSENASTTIDGSTGGLPSP